MTTVNLLPPEVRKQRREAALAHRIRFAALCFLLLLGGIYALRTVQVFLIDQDLEELRAAQASVQVRLDQLADVSAQRDAVAAGRSLTATLLSGEVLWSQQLLRVAETVPSGVRFTSFNGQLTEDPTLGIVAVVTFAGASDTFVPTEAWLVRIAAQEGWANGWVSSLTSAEGGSFSVAGSYDLTPAALSARGGGPA